MNTRNPSFVKFLETITDAIFTNLKIDPETYFGITQEKKMSILYLVFKIIKNTLKIRFKYTEEELKDFIISLLGYNETIENYELAAILKDIINNFESINEISKPIKKSTPVIKIRKNNEV